MLQLLFLPVFCFVALSHLYVLFFHTDSFAIPVLGGWTAVALIVFICFIYSLRSSKQTSFNYSYSLSLFLPSFIMFFFLSQSFDLVTYMASATKRYWLQHLYFSLCTSISTLFPLSLLWSIPLFSSHLPFNNVLLWSVIISLGCSIVFVFVLK
ncbi:hypothetical protein GEMRC1_000746 [Eukaryota sp. GEM-RC1]